MKLRALLPTDDPQKHTDEDLLIALAGGSLYAMGIFYDRHHQAVRTLARRLLGDDASAEDVVQEVFISFPRAARRFRWDTDLHGFLLGITVKKARSHLRSTIRRRRLLERYAKEERQGPRNPEQDACRKELARRLVRALDCLSVTLREAFVLREIQGLDSIQVAVMLGVPEATIRTRLFHARSRLREFFSDEERS